LISPSPIFPFLFVTIAARHLLRSTCPRSPTSFSTLGQYPTTSTFIGVLGSLIASFPLHFENRKSHLFRFSLPFLAIRISASPFVHFYRTPFFPLRPLSLDYSLLNCVANNLSFALVVLPNRGPQHTVIERAFTRLVEQLLHFLFGLFWISRTVPTPLSTLVHGPSKQPRQCRAWTSPEFWRFV
jgi:hypothetical protein